MLTLLWTMTGEKVGNVKERLQSQGYLFSFLEKKTTNFIFLQGLLFVQVTVCGSPRIDTGRAEMGHSRQCVLSLAVSFFQCCFGRSSIQRGPFDSIKIHVISPTLLVVTKISLCVRCLCVLGMALLL